MADSLIHRVSGWLVLKLICDEVAKQLAVDIVSLVVFQCASSISRCGPKHMYDI